MVTRSSQCDPNRLKRLLDDRLPEAEQAAIVQHVDQCEGCRRRLESLAADDRWWVDAEEFLHGDGTDIEESILVDEKPLLEFLDPSDDPTKLGRLGTYEIEEVVGRGGMGVVLKGFEPSLSRHVAIKVLAPRLATSAAARRRFAREARAAAAVVHEHVVAIHAVDSFAGLPYLVMPYVPGASLGRRIEETGPLEVVQILRIGMQVASGLAAAHAQGLVHRDVKPANILLESGVERVMLTDFGLARAADDASLTQSGVVAGTPQFMSPEQASGDPIDHRADLFSLGSVLYAAATGHPPFRAETTMAVLRRICESTPRGIREVNPEIPDWLAEIIEKLHEKKPADRFASASELAQLLERHLGHLQHPSTVAMPKRLPRPRRKGRRAIIVVGVLLLLAALISGLVVSQWPEASDTAASGEPGRAQLSIPIPTLAEAEQAPSRPPVSIPPFAEVLWNDGLQAELDDVQQEITRLEQPPAPPLLDDRPSEIDTEIRKLQEELERPTGSPGS